jgi:hypothetical protein
MLIAGAAIRVFAMAGNLTSPSLAFPATTSPALRSRIIDIISQPECKFLRGRFINANTTLEYAGKTAALNRMIEQLAQCDGIRVHLAFASGSAAAWTAPNSPADASWTIHHNGWAGADWIEIQVNPASELIQLGLLEIPAFGKGASSAPVASTNQPAQPALR